MAQIRKPAFYEIKKLRDLISNIKEEEQSQNHDFAKFSYDVMHKFLPLNFQFINESFVSVEEKQFIGLIGLIPDSKKAKRRNINRLFLNKHYFDSGKQLIDFVVNKYGAEGTETFLTYVDDRNPELISLFTTGCGFRACPQQQIWKLEHTKPFEAMGENISIREFKNSDAQAVAEIYSQDIYPQYKQSLVKPACDFRKGVFKNTVSLKFVVENVINQSIEGFVEIKSEGNTNYMIEMTMSLFYYHCCGDVLNFIIGFIISHQSDANVFIKLKKFCQSSKPLLQMLESHNFKCVQSQQVLIKDYWKTIKNDVKKPVLLFNDITNPAFQKCKINLDD